MNTFRAIRAATLASLIFSATEARGQTIRGRILDAASGAPVAGALAVLQPVDGGKSPSFLTDSAGHYALTGSQVGGRFVIRVERIGYVTAVTDTFVLTTDVTRNFDVATSAIQLDAIKSTGNSCKSSERLDPREALLWEEIRKALSTQIWTAQTVKVQYDWMERRVLRSYYYPDLITSSEDTRSSGIAFGSFFAASMDSMSERGFIRKSGRDYLYYGADAELIMSDAFQSTHCFHSASDRSRPTLIGLAFESSKSIKPYDIKGTLWLDRTTSRLVSVDFFYTGSPVQAPTNASGGTVVFSQMSNGMWIVSEWKMWSPIIAQNDGKVAILDERLNRVLSASVDGRVVYHADPPPPIAPAIVKRRN